MAVVRKNIWTSNTDGYLADFSGEFTKPYTVKELKDIVSRLIIITNKHEICKFCRLEDTDDYMRNMDEVLDKYGIFYPFSENIRFEDKWELTTKLFVYNNQGLLKKVTVKAVHISSPNDVFFVKDVNFFNNFQFSKENFLKKYEMVRPVTLSIPALRKSQVPPYEIWHIGGQINTSIWLASIPNYETGRKYMLDNKILAYRNTPRLNSFLRDFKELILEFGGVWYMGGNRGGISDESLNMDGIPIDGKIIYQEDVDAGRFIIPEFDSRS